MLLATNLGGNVCYGSFHHRPHPVNVCITGASSLGLLVNWAWWCEDMFICLETVSVERGRKIGPYWNKQATAQKPIPRIFLIIRIICIQKHRPLIPCNLDLPVDELGPGAGCNMVSYSVEVKQMWTHSEWFQSRPTGHNNAPMCSWWNPWPDLTLCGIWGLRLCPLGVIQSIMALFIPFVSSARAPLAPFWIWWGLWTLISLGRLWSTYQICDLDDLFLWWIHKTTL